MKTKSTLMITVLIIATLLAGCAGAALAQTETPANGTESSNKVTRLLTVNGSGKVYLTPDMVYVTIGVHTEGDNAVKTVAENNASTQDVIDTIKGMKIDEKDIQTTNFSISPQKEYDQAGKPTGKVLYIVDNSVYVTVRDLNKIGDVLDATVKSGANSINGIQFDVADKTKALTEARQSAVKDANSKAQELASAAGVTLGAVQTISEYTSSGPLPMYDRAAAPMAIEAAAVPVQAGQMLLTIEVSIVYEIK
jgi:uncharacterized protein YggE